MNKKTFLCTIATAVLLAAGTTAQAANITWANSAGNTNWTSGSSWVGGTAPVSSTATDYAIFQGVSNAQPFLNVTGTRGISGMDIQLASGGLNLTGSAGGTLDLGALGIDATTQTSGTNTIAVDNIRFGNGGSNMIWDLFATGSSAGTSTLNVSSAIDLAGATGGIILDSRRYDGGANQGVVNFTGAISGTNTNTTYGLTFRSQLNAGAALNRLHNTVNLTGNNSFDVEKIVIAGVTLTANSLANDGSNSALGKSGDIVIGNSADSYRHSGALVFQNLSANGTTDRAVQVQGGETSSLINTIVNNDATYTVAFTSTAATHGTYSANVNTSGTTVRTLEFGGINTGSNSFAGTIVNPTNSGTGVALAAVTKVGAGKWILTGNNTYDGTTGITVGTLIINGDQSGATGNVTVSSNATLGGSGTIGGATTVSGILAPGNSIGTLTIANDLTWNGGASAGAATDWKFELGAGNTADRVNLTGAGSDFLKGTGSAFRFDFQNSTAIGTFVLVDWAGTTDFLSTNFTYTNLGGVGHTGTFQFNGTQLEFVAVPEPQTVALLLGTFGLACLLRPRRKS